MKIGNSSVDICCLVKDNGQGDDASLVDCCTTHSSIFVIYFDESGTNPDNRIPVIAVGQQVNVGYQQNESYDHFSWAKTVCSIFSTN